MNFGSPISSSNSISIKKVYSQKNTQGMYGRVKASNGRFNSPDGTRNMKQIVADHMNTVNNLKINSPRSAVISER